ncbi:type I phosphomannose isomerase catalytic subunit [Carboxylicivirga sp. M1479]|uniref:type I phosphomannose isomerase catalytic subunit n=1 Tax=Carboxylicivirga sp. M1479 TaxID=2594476 RepID=UPI0011787062|nr:type I phosphomannose isomerase catalytic subunit [Carboxylicivirga sp. M1479]TRX65941.1 mannose-6-phosphate isomerase [Carboxylicivirga sp. M1479]
MLYPLKFTPILKEMIWGGKKIPSTLNIDTPDDVKIGESFAVSGLKNDLSVVSNGSLAGNNMLDLIEKYKGQLLGEEVYQQFGTNFPLLIKYIDANDDLSIQVHPNDELAKEKHDSFGKTEMWYVMATEKDASLISGFSRKTDTSEFDKLHSSGRLMELMQKHTTAEGDAFFIPAGKVHSIGSGNLVAEIQQTSDITYRIYDFDRKDKMGNSRELHHELAMDAMNFTDDESGKVNYQNKENTSNQIASCQYFTTNMLCVKGNVSTDYSELDSFVILMNVGGSCQISAAEVSIELNEMEAVLIPASLNQVVLQSDEAKILEVYI